MAAGIKKNGNLDLGLLVSDRPARVAAVFTKNRVQAAPVQLDRERVKSGTARAVIVNAGNANCANGKQGLVAARAMTAAAARVLNVPEDQVLAASTGVIGAPFPIEKVEAAMPALVGQLDENGVTDLARAIMTTDTRPKMAAREGSVDNVSYRIVAVAKGAGMIRPDMATMLCFVCTDADISVTDLKTALNRAVDGSFNRITIDGDTSTNDTVILMASGASGSRIASDTDKETFQRLVKTAFFGEDANWGRIIGAAGRAGVFLDPDRLDLYFDDVQMVEDGTGCGLDAEEKVTRVLKKPEFSVTLDLNLGEGTATMLTCDFSLDYVKINADYRS
ncbi:MAG: bifunctional ornithine acetyltransferase/N-acetylglutamate synthase [Desulfosarcina sp.]|nr:bifunctional ornithine acetyltransferase/N-acetylglutamate synthase [Desulfosarcina sp.]MBC2766277.1 bifunctional ornithine acetyltransferase/N-acetylglutamate synthase [Desulfosarcina sp.]